VELFPLQVKTVEENYY